MAYRPGLLLVLKNFSATIQPGEKVGICGRTGASKSSISVALYRLAEIFSGRIAIDGVGTATLGLYNLRSKLSIISQDSVLFEGTVRKNLDQFGENSDNQLWTVLHKSNITADKFDTVGGQSPSDRNLHKFHLNCVADNKGANISLGERQLVALAFARALVRDTRILVLDGATSSVDYATDKKTQVAIMAEFGNCTILAIAQRFKTILQYDCVIVMEQGPIVECDTPKNLFAYVMTHFRQMCDKTCITAADF